MSEDGRDEVAAHVPRGTLSLLDGYVARLREGAARQNLVAASTLDAVWRRHVLDSLQLVQLATVAGRWIDVGSGAGLPGLVVAIATERPMILIEPRRLRAAFLAETIAALGLGERVEVRAQRCEAVTLDAPAAIVSARAVAPLGRLFAMAAHLADGRTTQWLLPKGRGAAAELAEAERTWQGAFRLVPSLTDPQATIVAARQVRRKRQG